MLLSVCGRIMILFIFYYILLKAYYPSLFCTALLFIIVIINNVTEDLVGVSAGAVVNLSVCGNSGCAAEVCRQMSVLSGTQCQSQTASLSSQGAL